jgi:hypothetical protein
VRLMEGVVEGLWQGFHPCERVLVLQATLLLGRQLGDCEAVCEQRQLPYTP